MKPSVRLQVLHSECYKLIWSSFTYRLGANAGTKCLQLFVGNVLNVWLIIHQSPPLKLPYSYILLSSDDQCRCGVLPEYEERDLILARLVPDSAGRERELSGRVIWARCLGSGCGPAISRTSRWSMKGTIRPGKANFQPFSPTMQSCKTNVVRRGLRWTRISGYLPNLRHLLTHRDRWRETIREEKSREETEINAERAEERFCSSEFYSADSKLRGG